MSAIDELRAKDSTRVRTARPRFHPPMLATLTDDRFSDGGWLFELKLDGVRVQVIRDGDDIQLVSRNSKTLNSTYPELVDAFRRQSVDRFVVDGEVVALDENGVPSFARLQGRMQLTDAAAARRSRIVITYYAFDLLHLDGYDVTSLDVSKRKLLLRRALRFRKPLQFSAHRTDGGEAFLEEACRRGFEGLIAKRAHSRYVERRSSDWLKLKCERSQEFVIGGYTEPRGSRAGLGAILLGYYDGDDFVYAGKVGTGFDAEMLSTLARRLESLERSRSPFDRGKPTGSGVHWVRPELVCDVAFTEWTRDGSLRHPRFKGLRQDKPARAVVRERPRSAA
ncbi:MAG TPA: non-homologous end-joining DNA ligase [Acidimicrobiales bacterium]|nr:non-homologous end-joining DNA ligase [Acidimicrobiales bacterium]